MDALRAVGLDSFADRPAWRLSGGEVQRVAIARALAFDPEVYLLDEPTANIDRDNVPVIEALLCKLSAAGKGVVLTTHDIDQAYRLGTQVVVLEAGKLAPAPVLNVFRGEICDRAGNSYLDCAGLCIELPYGVRARTVAVDADDILVSQARIDSSARNNFRGTITGVEDDRRGIVVTVDCGQIVRARITPHSYAEMGLGVGSPVYLTFKSSAIRVRQD
jgi:molybdopterin-binding protein